MQIQRRPDFAPRLPQSKLPPTNNPKPQPLPQPDPKPPAHFLESSRSLRRDSLLTGALASTVVLPKAAAMGVGAVVGTLGMLAGYGEVREGMRTMNTHEVIGGALHMGASAALLASAAMPGSILGGFVAAGGVTVLAAKTLYDRPKDVADVVFRQPLALVRDAGKSIWLEFKGAEKS